MSHVTQILASIDAGDAQAAEQLLPLVYDELRRLAAAKLAQEKPGQTLQATALVHEAYLRLVGGAVGNALRGVPGDRRQETGDGELATNLSAASCPLSPAFDSRGHFFAAAAEAMRRILVENARRKQRIKHGGLRERVDLLEIDLAVHTTPEEILAVDEGLARLAAEDAQAAELVKRCYFLGLSVEDAAAELGISRATAYRHWTYARAWLRCEILGERPNS